MCARGIQEPYGCQGCETQRCRRVTLPTSSHHPMPAADTPPVSRMASFLCGARDGQMDSVCCTPQLHTLPPSLHDESEKNLAYCGGRECHLPGSPSSLTPLLYPPTAWLMGPGPPTTYFICYWCVHMYMCVCIACTCGCTFNWYLNFRCKFLYS